MATGIQTGLGRTGTGIAPPGKPPSANGMAKVMATWGSLSPKTRIFSILGTVAVLVIGLMSAVMWQASQPVRLYSFDLSETDQKEVIAKLTTDNDPFTVVGGKIMVPPSSRQKLAAYLMEYGLPHRPLEAGPKDGGGMIPPSDKEKEQMRLQELQAKLIEQMRVLSFVADAYVEIVPADEEGALMGQAKPATAQVMLQLKPGTFPSREQIDAIISMVAYSVRGLDPANVKVMDDQGKILSHAVAADSKGGPTGADASDVSPTGEENLALKSAFEKQFRDKVAPSLDRIFGPDRYTLNVDCQIDYSQKKIVSTTYGDSKPLETNEKKESFNNKPGASSSPEEKKGSKEVALSNFNTGSGGSGGNDTSYVKTEVKNKNAVDQTQREVVIPAGALQKVTASLAVDRSLSDAQQKQWETFLKTAMGMDESRGDMVTVMSAAFADARLVTDLNEKRHEFVPGSNRDPFGVSPQVIALAMGGSVLLLLSLVAVFLMKQHKVQVDKSSLLLSTGGSSSHTTEITDLLNEKSGKVTGSSTQTTTVNNRAELEKLAKEKPTRVAELLKSTWLSEKER